MERDRPVEVASVASVLTSNARALYGLSPEALEDRVAGILSNALGGLVEEGSDLQGYVQKLARMALRATAEGRSDLTDMIVHQAQALSELHRIKLRRVAWGVATDVIKSVFQAFLLGGL